MNERSLDDVMERLAEARPVAPAPDPAADAALYDRVALAPAGAAYAKPRWRWTGLGAAAVAAAVVAVGVSASPRTSGPSGGTATAPPSSAAGPQTIDVRTIVASTQAAVRGTGRATVRYVSGIGLESEQRGTIAVNFAGDDIDMTIAVEGQQGRPGFTSHNRTVDGSFYLLDGVPGNERWIKDTNETGTRDMFSLDPRTLLANLSSSAGFVDAGDGANGERHLRATDLAGVPALNVGMGPTTGETFTGLDLWVGADDVVHRLDLGLTSSYTSRAGARAIVITKPDGTKEKIIDPADTTPETTVVVNSTYSLAFSDLGAAITVTAPEQFTSIAGKG